MGIVHTAFVHDKDFNYEAATNADVTFVYMYKLPFRLRVSSPYRCHFVHKDSEFDIWVKNTLIEAPSPINDQAPSMARWPSEDDLSSTVAVFVNSPMLTTGELASVQGCGGDVASTVVGSSRTMLQFRVLEAVNAFIVGYRTVSDKIFESQSLRTLTLHDTIGMDHWEVTVIGLPLLHWSPDTIHELFDLTGQATIRSQQVPYYDLSELPAEQAASIPRAIELFNDFYFYELRFEAQVKMFSHDYTGGLIMAVAALEGVHAVYLDASLRSRLPTGRTGEDKDLEENFIKTLGFSLCNKLTPYLFMTAADRPSAELIKKTAQAISYRNDIMHSKRTKDGASYLIRMRTDLQLQEAYSATLDMYEIYRTAFESLLADRVKLPGE